MRCLHSCGLRCRFITHERVRRGCSQAPRPSVHRRRFSAVTGSPLTPALPCKIPFALFAAREEPLTGTDPSARTRMVDVAGRRGLLPGPPGDRSPQRSFGPRLVEADATCRTLGGGPSRGDRGDGRLMAMHHVHGSASIRAFGVHRRDLGDGRPSRRSQARRLRLALILTGAFMVLEVVGGLLADSLALLADAGHMLTDGLALALSLIAIRLATRPASPEHTFGYVRLEVLAALINGAVLLGISGWIAWEAWERLHAPREVNGPLLMAVATLGLVANLVCAALLRDHAGRQLERSWGVSSHSGRSSGFRWDDRGGYDHPVHRMESCRPAPLRVCCLVDSGWCLAPYSRGYGGASGEGTSACGRGGSPRTAQDDPEPRGCALHVWTLTSGFVALSGHGVRDDPAHHQRVLDEIRERMAEHGIEHVTFQLEPRFLTRSLQ